MYCHSVLGDTGKTTKNLVTAGLQDKNQTLDYKKQSRGSNHSTAMLSNNYIYLAATLYTHSH
jgi:hypothetical protein